MCDDDLLQPEEYKVVETIYDMDDDEVDLQHQLHDELLSLDKNVMELYGTLVDYNEFGPQLVRSLRNRRKRGWHKK